MELRQLRYFVTVATELHFGHAADRLQITQPALSKQIVALEQELGVMLLQRTKRSVELTPAGQVFLTQSQQLLAQADTAVQLTQRTARGEVGQLTIGFTETAAHSVLPQLVRDFRQRYPQVEIIMCDLSTEAQVAALNQEMIDIAFLHPPIDARGLCVHDIFEEQFMIVLPLGHPLAKQESVTVEDLAEESFLIHPRHEGPILYEGFLQICRAAGFQPKIAQELLSLQTRVCLVSAGIGITFVSDRLQALVGTEVICRPIANCPMQLQFAAAWRENHANPTLTAFLSILHDRNP